MSREKPYYKWQGPERRLRGATAAEVRVYEVLEGSGGSLVATGHALCVDYVEGGIRFECPFRATAADPRLMLHGWSVEVAKSNDFFHDRTSGKPMFTCSTAIDESILAFIGQQLGHMMELRAADPEADQIVDSPVLFAGDITVRCGGECLCEKLEVLIRTDGAALAARSTEHPNDTVRRLKKELGKPIPERCFPCSCGKNWWMHMEDESWYPVPDETLWAVLMQHDGEAVSQVGVWNQTFDASGRHPGFYLMQTLRDDGLIPLG